MSVALFASIWLALALFVSAEAAKRQSFQRPEARRRVRLISAGGALLCATHILLAFATRHGWSHDAAVRETARQTAAVFGLSWGGSIYVNYAFVIVWLIDAWTWQRPGPHNFERSRITKWTLRTFYLVVIANAAIVFARGPVRPIGIGLVVALLWVWRPLPTVNHFSRCSIS